VTFYLPAKRMNKKHATKRKASIDTIRPAKKVIIEKTEEIDGLKSEIDCLKTEINRLKTEINRLNCGSKKLPVPDKHHCKEWMKICCIENSGEQHVDDLRKKQAIGVTLLTVIQ